MRGSLDSGVDMNETERSEHEYLVSANSVLFLLSLHHLYGPQKWPSSLLSEAQKVVITLC